MPSTPDPSAAAVQPPSPPALELRLDGAEPSIRLIGDWRRMPRAGDTPSAEEILARIPTGGTVVVDGRDVTVWGSGLLTWLRGLYHLAMGREITLETDTLPTGARRLMALATEVPARGGRDEPEDESLAFRVGAASIDTFTSARDVMTFVGEIAIATTAWVRGRSSTRGRDLVLLIQDCGLDALPIVALINFLIGMIIAFVGALQLEMFGAQVFVANLVSVAMTRELAAMMTAIIMAGRTGAAFAAQLGTMTVNEEIDAFRSLGISPVEVLVVPRVLALVLMMPLLCLYADFVGIAGGAFVGKLVLGVDLQQYAVQVQSALDLTDVAAGLFKSVIYAFLVAVAGCFWGLRSGRSASSMGAAVTTAVVTMMLWIIVASALTTMFFTALGV